MPTIALTMIVKDEASVIARALDSVKPLIDQALIEDTGSTDGTQKIVANWLESNNVPGRIIEEPWRDFAYNRTHVLAALREIDVDYALMLDADDIVQINNDPATIKASLTKDAYALPIRHGTLAHQRVQLCRNRKPFRFRGVVHEALYCDEPFQQAPLDDVSILIVGGGVRGRDGKDAVYRRDAELLTKAIADGTDKDLEPRYTFYLAQSYRDCGELSRALHAYLQRIELGGWREEIYVSLLNAARLQERLNYPFDGIIGTYKKAIALIPTRAEAIYGAARAFRFAERYAEACAIAEQGIKLPLYKGLFVEAWIYNYGLLDEFSICAYYAGHRTESWLATQLILRGNLDDATRKRVAKNAEFARG